MGHFPGSTVVFGSYTAFGKDNAHGTSQRICEVCHTITAYHTYNNAATNHNGNDDCTRCHKHSSGFKGSGGSLGGSSCDTAGCHNDLYGNSSGSNYGMHSNVAGMSYKHYMDNALTTSDATLTGGMLGKSWYATNLPDSTTRIPQGAALPDVPRGP